MKKSLLSVVPQVDLTEEMFPCESYELDGILFSVAPTWVMKDTVKFADFKKDLQSKPHAKRDYGCIPTAPDSSYLPNPELIEMRANRDREDPWDIENLVFKPWFKAQQRDYFVHCDFSTKKDSTGLAMCVAKGTRIPTDRGLFLIEDLVDGDRVFDGTAWRRCKVYKTGKKRVRRFMTKGGRGVSLTDTHPVQSLATKNSRSSVVWRNAGDLRSGYRLDSDGMIMSLGGCCTTEYQKIGDFIFNEDFAWAFGFWLGDGSMSRNRLGTGGYRVVFLCMKLQEQLAVTEAMKSIFGLLPKINSVKLNSGLVLNKLCYNRKWLFELFCSLNQWDRGCRKRVPEIVFRSPRTVVESFIMGWLEADGTVTLRGDVCGYSASHEIVENISILANYIGVANRIVKTSRGSNLRLERAAWIRFEVPFKQERLERLSGSINLPRRRFGKHYCRGSSFIIERFSHASEERLEDTYDVSLDSEPHQFIADGFVVHNCHYEERAKKIVVDLMIDLRVPQGGELILSRTRLIIYELQRMGFRIFKMTLDSWNSVDSIQEFKRHGIPAEVFSVDENTKAYDTLIDCVDRDFVDYYQQAIFFSDIKCLRLVGKKVNHSAGGSKDLSDAVAGAVFQCYLKVPKEYYPRSV